MSAPLSKQEIEDVSERSPKNLQVCVQKALEDYFAELDDQLPSSLYQMVLSEIEPPLLRTVMHHARGNQSKAAQILGINRSTLRKKLARYHL